MNITFIGATETVTGSKTLINFSEIQVLVDSGLYQEGEKFSSLNKENLSFDPKLLEAIIITHAHLDHCGFLPFLYHKGFRGNIYLTEESAKLVRIILSDSANLLKESDDPLYTVQDAHNVVSLFRPKVFEEKFYIQEGEFVFHKAAHILGAAFLEFRFQEKAIVFSGDLGRVDDPLLGHPDKLTSADYLIVESTYGGHNRIDRDKEKVLIQLLEKIHTEKMNLLIPSFALHRSQLLVYLFKEIFTSHPHLKCPLYVNSPMIEDITKVYNKYLKNFQPRVIELDPWRDIYFLNGYHEIERVNNTLGPQIIIASSGMITGGRIWSHLKDLAPKKDTLLFLPGFQAPETTGWKILKGEKAIISPDGKEIKLAAEVKHSDAFSSHAEQSELLNWILFSDKKIKNIFLIHGEEDSKKAFAKILEKEGMNVVIPKKNQTLSLAF